MKVSQTVSHQTGPRVFVGGRLLYSVAFSNRMILSDRNNPATIDKWYQKVISKDFFKVSII